MATNTPWGTSQLTEKIAPGIMSYVTASHGGYHLSPSRMASLPDAFKTAKPFLSDGWFEEDCDWAIVFLAFPTEFFTHLGPEAYVKHYHEAERTLRNWHPDTWEAHFGRKLKVGESYKKDKELTK